MTDYTIGADPEFFVKKGRHFLSGHIFQCGTKRHPMKTEHGYVQVDGIALECNVRPASSRDEFVRNISGVRSDLDAIVKKENAGLVVRPSIFYGQKKLTALPVENAELGCDPDFNAYTARRNRSPQSALPIRTGAGHIHIGWTKNENPRNFDFFDKCATIVRQLDYYLGLPSLLWDKDDRRRSLYGQAGAFRPKPYGLEYRVLSNKWLGDDRLIGWIYDRTIAACVDVENKMLMEQKFGDLAARMINDGVHDWPERNPELAEMVLV